MGVHANQMLMDAVRKVADALKDKRSDKKNTKTAEHEAGQSPSAKSRKISRKKQNEK